MLKLIPPTRTAKFYGRDKVVFHVAPSMTKHEVKEYLTKVYDVPVGNSPVLSMSGMAGKLDAAAAGGSEPPPNLVARRRPGASRFAPKS